MNVIIVEVICKVDSWIWGGLFIYEGEEREYRVKDWILRNVGKWKEEEF